MDEIIVMDEIGPREGRLDSRGIEIPLEPAGKGGAAQFPASDRNLKDLPDSRSRGRLLT